MKSTLFPLGAYLGNPYPTDPAADASFNTTYDGFTMTLGVPPTFITAYVDYTKPVNEWINNASFQAYENALSPLAKGLIPVIGLPMASTAAGSESSDAFFKQFAAGDFDGVIQGVVHAWAAQGFKTQYWRPGWEMNLSGTPYYAGDTPASQADWVAAFQHISTVLHQAGVANGVNVQVIWNPGIVNYSNAEATTALYPGNQYVDQIGADIYADLYPYGTAGAIYDWAKNGQVLNAKNPIYSSLQQWASDPINLTHYYTHPASTQYSLDGSGGHSLSLQNLIDFAKAQGKPLAIPETGAGATGDGAAVADNPTFVTWLHDTLVNAGVPITLVNIWDSNGGGNYEFSQPSDHKPLEAAAWAQSFGAGSVAAPPCFLAGTRIATARGNIAVEHVLIGDLCRTASGEWRPVTWIGSRMVDVRRHRRPGSVRPIRVAADAFGAGAPARDLWLSPDHALWLDGWLVPIRLLVNGEAVSVDATIERASYHHLELDRHDVILAEGLPVESFLDTGNKRQFAGAISALHPDFAARTWEAAGCAPLAVAGPVIDRATALLEDRARRAPRFARRRAGRTARAVT